ncbi:MAG: hypothetical protein ABIV25_13605, partial [Paracoccaceae bacterium]
FSYAAFANLTVYEEPGGKLAAFDMAALRGTVTQSFDTLYKTAMPHRAASVGLMGAARYVLMGEGRKGVLVGQGGWLFTAEEARPLPQDLMTSVRHIAEVNDYLASKGTRLVLIPIPAKVDVEAANANQPELSAEMAAFYAGFVADLKGDQIAMVDARTPLVALAKTDRAYFATDTHWTLAGASAVATAVAQSGLVKLGTAQTTRKDLPAKSFAGDLISYVTSADLAADIGLPPEQAKPYLVDAASGDAGDIFAATAVDVVLVGTSYSANPDWSFAEALKLSLHSDVLNVAEQGLGPVTPLDTYLKSDSFRDAPPKVLIWEFPLRYLTDPKLWDGHKIGEVLASAD